jgi:hypothetical protein
MSERINKTAGQKAKPYCKGQMTHVDYVENAPVKVNSKHLHQVKMVIAGSSFLMEARISIKFRLM